MRKKLIIALIMFVAGILIIEIMHIPAISGIADLWILRIVVKTIGWILWIVGMFMGTNALISLKKNKKTADDT